MAALNRVEKLLEQWDVREQKYVSRHGNNVLNNRDFLKIKQQRLGEIERQARKNKKLTDEEKDDLKILRAMRRELSVRITPNRWKRWGLALLRGIVNAAVFTAKIIGAAVLAVVAVLAGRKKADDRLSQQRPQPLTSAQKASDQLVFTQPRNLLGQKKEQQQATKKVPERVQKAAKVAAQITTRTVAPRKRAPATARANGRRH